MLFPLLFHEPHSFKINLFLVTYEWHLPEKFEFHSNAEEKDRFASALRQDTNLPLPAIISVKCPQGEMTTSMATLASQITDLIG